MAALRLAEQLGRGAAFAGVMCDTGMKHLKTHWNSTELIGEGSNFAEDRQAECR
jgi:hypothetical protein